MKLPRSGNLPPWGFESIAISGLLLAIAVAGLVGLALNAHVESVTNHALQYDVRLEGLGDDFRVGVLDMRHYHRNILFAGPSRHGLANFETAYLQLVDEIAQLEQLGLDDPHMPPLDEVRRVAEVYYADFRPAIDFYSGDPQAFALASDQGLVRLAELESTARRIDQLGEQRAAAALLSVERAATTARIALFAIIGGLILVGGILAYLAARIFREQKEAAAQLAQALRAKTDFIADASHELRTPLTVLRANAEVALELERMQGAAGEHTELIEEIVHESERMTRLIADLLLLARSDSGSLPLEVERVELEPFLAELAARAGVLARQHNAVLHTDLRAIGQADIDPARIEQAILILVDNGAKFSSGRFGKDAAPITLRAQTQNSQLVVEVVDQGPGIAPEDLPRVFERFYRVDKARSRRQGGSGLGLAIAKSIVEAHDGRIEAESVPGAGTTMRIQLPLVDESSAAAPALPAVETHSLALEETR
jgi:signal transduction histidine kinase